MSYDKIRRKQQPPRWAKSWTSIWKRVSRGERPIIEEYAERYPDLADVIRKMLPALEVMQMSTEVGATADSRASDETYPVGTLGDYRIVCEVGRGGMGAWSTRRSRSH